GDDVINAETILRVRKRNFPHLAALAAVKLYDVLDRALHFRVEPFPEVLLGNPDPPRTSGGIQRRAKIRDRHVKGRGVMRIMSRNRLEQDGRILDGAREGTDLVERGRERREAIT